MDFQFEGDIDFVKEVYEDSHATFNNDAGRVGADLNGDISNQEKKPFSTNQKMGILPNSINDKFVSHHKQNRYQNEIAGIRTLHGGLDQMRAKLNLSRRQVCRELMVDPSAWTRWTANGEESAPPHVYKLLALLLEKRQGGENNKSDFALRVMDDTRSMESSYRPVVASSAKVVVEASGQGELDKIKIELAEVREQHARETLELKSLLEKHQILSLGWKVLFVISFVMTIYLYIF